MCEFSVWLCVLTKTTYNNSQICKHFPNSCQCKDVYTPPAAVGESILYCNEQELLRVAIPWWVKWRIAKTLTKLAKTENIYVNESKGIWNRRSRKSKWSRVTANKLCTLICWLLHIVTDHMILFCDKQELRSTHTGRDLAMQRDFFRLTDNFEPGCFYLKT